MADDMPILKFNFPLEECLNIAVRLHVAMQRDATDLLPWGITAQNITDFNGLISACMGHKPIEVWRSEITTLTETVNSACDELRKSINFITKRAKSKWGARSSKVKEFRAGIISKQTESMLLWTAGIVRGKAAEYLSELSDKGVTQDLIDDVEAAEIIYKNAITALITHTNASVKATENRINAFNALYDKMVEYSESGKGEYEYTDPAKYPDYVLTGNSNLPNTPPNTPINLRLIGNEFLFDADPNATSHNVRVTLNGTTYSQEYNGLEDPFVTVTLPSSGGVQIEVQSNNAAGLSAFAVLLVALTLAGPANFRFENGAFRYDPVFGAKLYEMRYRPAAGGAYIQVFTNGNLIYEWMPPSGDWIFEIRAINGDIMSDWMELPLFVA